MLEIIVRIGSAAFICTLIAASIWLRNYLKKDSKKRNEVKESFTRQDMKDFAQHCFQNINSSSSPDAALNKFIAKQKEKEDEIYN